MRAMVMLNKYSIKVKFTLPSMGLNGFFSIFSLSLREAKEPYSVLTNHRRTLTALSISIFGLTISANNSG